MNIHRIQECIIEFTVFFAVYVARGHKEIVTNNNLIIKRIILFFCVFLESDAFYEATHGLNEYPGLVVVRAAMNSNGRAFRADAVGMNRFHFSGLLL